MVSSRTTDPDVTALLEDAAGDQPLRGTFFLNDAGEAAVRAVGHLAVNHGANALRDAVQRYEPAVVFLPGHLQNPSLLDRVRGNTLPALRRAVGGPIRLVSVDGTVEQVQD